MNIRIKREAINLNKYFLVDYLLDGTAPLGVNAWNLAVGQSVGNPNVRNEWETDELFANHSCMIVDDGQSFDKPDLFFSHVTIAFPYANIDFRTDGVSQLLCQIMGGQLDIDSIKRCMIIDIHIKQETLRHDLPGVMYGLTGARGITNVYDKPLLGAIVKPKIGMSVSTLLDMVKQLVDSGVNFIKEDEIMGSPLCCPFKDRVLALAKYLEKKDIIYCACINSDAHEVLSRAAYADYYNLGVHLNVWSGLGTYRAVRERTNAFIHFQKSGDAAFTSPYHMFSISWNAICKIAAWSGADSIHAGMWGGYAKSNEAELKETLAILHEHNVLPALSCGMHPGLIGAINEKFGTDYMANVGGAIHGHPGGTVAGVKAMRQAIDGNYGVEYYQAVDKWGIVEP